MQTLAHSQTVHRSNNEKLAKTQRYDVNGINVHCLFLKRMWTALNFNSLSLTCWTRSPSSWGRGGWLGVKLWGGQAGKGPHCSLLIKVNVPHSRNSACLSSKMSNTQPGHIFLSSNSSRENSQTKMGRWRQSYGLEAEVMKASEALSVTCRQSAVLLCFGFRVASLIIHLCDVI